MEGVSWFVVLDVQTKETRMFEQTAETADLASFKWIDDRTFVANMLCGDRTDCPKSQFRGNISQLFTKSL